MQISLPLSEHRPWRERWFPNGEWALALVLLFEIAIFSRHRRKLLQRRKLLRESSASASN